MSRPLLEIPREIYAVLIKDLARSGRGVKEAGAFLLGHLDDERRRVSAYIMYDTVAKISSRKHAFVAFTAEEMAIAWERCNATGLQVVADVHTHPMGPGQSATDQAHPIVSLAGHVALIVPYFATRNPQPSDLGVHVFEGAGRWCSFFDQAARDALLLV